MKITERTISWITSQPLSRNKSSIFILLHQRVIMTQIYLLKNQTYPKDPYLDKILSLTPSHTPHFIPLLRHGHYQIEKLISLLSSATFLEDVKYLIITSQRAVESLSYALSQISRENKRKILQDKIWYTVGPASEKVLQELGVLHVRGGIEAGHGGILSEIIINDLEVVNELSEKVVFFTGVIRRDIIPKRLAEAGIDLNEVVIYQTVERDDILSAFTDLFKKTYLYPSRDDESIVKPWLIFFSPQGTAPIVKYLQSQPDLLSQLRIASIGPTTETYLKGEGIKVDLVSSKPDAEILVREITGLE